MQNEVHEVNSNTFEAPQQKSPLRIRKLSSPLNPEKPTIQNQNADQASIDHIELGVELQSNESVDHLVQVNVAPSVALLAAPAAEETTASTGVGIDLSPPLASGEADLSAESTAQAGAHSQQSIEEAIRELASLDPLEYERLRTEKAKTLGIRLPTLDAAVEGAKSIQSEAGSSPFPEVVPHPEPIDPVILLNDLVAIIRQYIVVEEHEAIVLALWVALTWFLDAVDYAPLVIIDSPEKGCGKSQLLKVIGRLSYRPLHASNSSASPIFRVVESSRPTILIDEADTFFRGNAELHGMVNAGYQRDGFVLRSESVGGKIEPRAFSVFSAKALAGIDLKKHLPDATMSRGHVINLRRKLPHESVSRLRHADSSSFTALTKKLLRFSVDYSEQVRLARPDLPHALSDRTLDNCEPLLAIASCAGVEWFARATAAFVKQSDLGEKKVSTGNQLLADIQLVFVDSKLSWISTANLITTLCEDDENAWATFNRGGPVSARQLASQLEEYGIKSYQRRLNAHDNPVRGFALSQFSDAFARYLPALPISPLPSLQPPSVTPEVVSLLGCNTVTDQTVTQGRPDESRLSFDQRMDQVLPKSLRI